MHMHRLIICSCFLFTCTCAAADLNYISVNCGGVATPATTVGGRPWGEDAARLSGGSSTTVETKEQLLVDPVPYRTARISRSQFSYTFHHLTPGQKFIRLHFNPASYYGFESLTDFFTVEAGPFTLLANFSASLTARALSLNVLSKEFCIIIPETQPLHIVFSPQTYAFINGIEIISLPSTIPYCHAGDNGVAVLGQRSHVVYVDNTTALERVYHQNLYMNSDDDMFLKHMEMEMEVEVEEKATNAANLSWEVAVDVGFRYLFRIHLRDVSPNMQFILLIDSMVALTSDDTILQQGQNQRYNNYMVMVEGQKREGKRTISISLNSRHGFLDRHGPLQGFEVFKLSNHDRSLATPNPLPPTTPSPSHYPLLYSLLGPLNTIAALVFTVLCVVNIIVHSLQKLWGADMTEEETKPSARPTRLCRIFTLAEIQSATRNFHSTCIIGKGGFGIVYKGFIDDGRDIVAIKRSKPDSKQGELQFWTEVEMLSELRHVNLVSLIGYCIDQREMNIVYEYMPDGTLADHLYKLARKSKKFYPLSWKQRLKICIGASRALDYLHTGHGIIHRDVKASNILLDEKFVAKVSDFGLAKTGSLSESQSQDSTNMKGTFGYIDPKFFTTRKLTKESDMYSFGVVLLEVLCGRPAVEPSYEEDKQSLVTWAIDNISKGQVDDIVAPSLRGEISTDSLKTFVRVAERCLLDEPKKRPAAAHVVIKLELALKRQEKAESLAPISFEDVFSSIEKSQNENMNFLAANEKINGADVLHQKGDGRSSAQDEIKNVTDSDRSHRTILSVNMERPMNSSYNIKTYTSPWMEQSNSTMMVNSGRKDGKKSMMHRISRKLWPRYVFQKTKKASNKTALVGTSLSAPLSRRTSNTTLGGNTITNKRIDGMSSAPTLRIFSFEELKAGTRNFHRDTVLGEGGFGRVYKCWVHEKSSAKEGSGSIVAVKKLNHESMQGFQEWQSEVQFLGRLSHPNLVKLLGYGWEDQELFLVYEFMEKGSLESQLFESSYQPLPWDRRLNILIGAARGLAFLHSSEIKVIHRDFKSSNILLDESCNAKISDFGLARMGPFAGNSHVSTRVLGTRGYAAPEYVATGHLTERSDTYGFGVVLLEVVTGRRADDRGRPAEERNLVEWVKPRLSESKGRNVSKIIDPRMEGRYGLKAAAQIVQLALHCLDWNPKSRPSMQQVVETLERRVDEKPRVQFSPHV